MIDSYKATLSPEIQNALKSLLIIQRLFSKYCSAMQYYNNVLLILSGGEWGLGIPPVLTFWKIPTGF